MNEIRLKKLVGNLLREVLNYPHPSKLPPEILRVRNAILIEAEDKAADEKTLKTAAQNTVQDIMAEAGTGNPETAPQRPPPIGDTGMAGTSEP